MTQSELARELGTSRTRLCANERQTTARLKLEYAQAYARSCGYTLSEVATAIELMIALADSQGWRICKDRTEIFDKSYVQQDELEAAWRAYQSVVNMRASSLPGKQEKAGP